MDILDQQQVAHGFAYSTAEAVKHIDMLATHEDLRSKIVLRASQGHEDLTKQCS